LFDPAVFIAEKKKSLSFVYIDKQIDKPHEAKGWILFVSSTGRRARRKSLHKSNMAAER